MKFNVTLEENTGHQPGKKLYLKVAIRLEKKFWRKQDKVPDPFLLLINGKFPDPCEDPNPRTDALVKTFFLKELPESEDVIELLAFGKIAFSKRAKDIPFRRW